MAGGTWERDLAAVDRHPIEGIAEHVRAHVEELHDPKIRAFFARCYARLCSCFDANCRPGADRSLCYRAGWDQLRDDLHRLDDFLAFLRATETIDSAATAASLNLHTRNCLLLFVLYDYLRCCDADRADRAIRALDQIFPRLPDLQHSDTYRAARACVLADLAAEFGRYDGGDK